MFLTDPKFSCQKPASTLLSFRNTSVFCKRPGEPLIGAFTEPQPATDPPGALALPVGAMSIPFSSNTCSLENPKNLSPVGFILIYCPCQHWVTGVTVPTASGVLIRGNFRLYLLITLIAFANGLGLVPNCKTPCLPNKYDSIVLRWVSLIAYELYTITSLIVPLNLLPAVPLGLSLFPMHASFPSHEYPLVSPNWPTLLPFR